MAHTVWAILFGPYSRFRAAYGLESLISVQNSVQTLRSSASGFATIIIHNLHRANHFTMAAVYVRCRYPMEVFGTLMGTFRCSMGITILINVGLNVIITKYDNGFNSGN